MARKASLRAAAMARFRSRSSCLSAFASPIFKRCGMSLGRLEERAVAAPSSSSSELLSSLSRLRRAPFFLRPAIAAAGADAGAATTAALARGGIGESAVLVDVGEG